MTQQINLYLEAFRRRRDPFAALPIGLGLLALVVVLGGLSGLLAWQARSAQARVEALESERQSVQSALGEQQQRLEALRAAQERDDGLQALRAELSAKQRLVDYLESGRFGTRGGFSAYLEGLARTTVEGLWLDRVELRAGARRIRLGGHALAPERVPGFLEGLAARETFSGYRFRTVRIDRAEDGERLDFLLASERAEDDG